MQERYEILPGLPATGPMYVTIPPDNYSEGFVVRFYKENGGEWIGNFKLGYEGLNTVIKLGQSKLLVIANGTCYVVDPETEKVENTFGTTYENRIDAPDGRVVLIDRSLMTILEPDGTYWHSSEFALHGIEDLTIKNNIVSGIFYNPTNETDDWYEFTFNLATKTFTGIDFFPERGPFTETKPWWKIW